MALREFPADRRMDRLSSVQDIREVADIGNEMIRERLEHGNFIPEERNNWRLEYNSKNSSNDQAEKMMIHSVNKNRKTR